MQQIDTQIIQTINRDSPSHFAAEHVEIAFQRQFGMSAPHLSSLIMDGTSSLKQIADLLDVVGIAHTFDTIVNDGTNKVRISQLAAAINTKTAKTVQAQYACNFTTGDADNIMYGIDDDYHFDNENASLATINDGNMFMTFSDSSFGVVRIAIMGASFIAFDPTTVQTNDTASNRYLNITVASFKPDLGEKIADAAMRHRHVSSDPEIYLIVTSPQGSFELLSSPITTPAIIPGTDIEAEFRELDNAITKKITERSRGLVLLHGAPGTGKTTYIRHLAAKLPHKKFIIVPPEVFENMSSPNFVRFVLRFCSDSVLVIEDSERILMTRAGADSSPGISALLNLGDGILGDAIRSPIICTFNMDVQHVDSALLRSGRLIKRHEFKAVSATDAFKILDELGVDAASIPSTIGAGVTIADVYRAASLLASDDTDDHAEGTRILTKTTRTFGFAHN